MVKQDLRMAMKDKRDALGRDYRKLNSERIASEIISLLDSGDFQKLHTFIPIQSEVNIRQAIQYSLDHSEQTFTSRTVKYGSLVHCSFTSLEQMVEGRFGTLHPSDCEPYEGTFDIILVPGLAFDQNGFRLGYGGGYYDRFLSKHRDALKVGICFPCQIIDHVPVDAHDVPVDQIIC